MISHILRALLTATFNYFRVSNKTRRGGNAFLGNRRSHGRGRILNLVVRSRRRQTHTFAQKKKRKTDDDKTEGDKNIITGPLTPLPTSPHANLRSPVKEERKKNKEEFPRCHPPKQQTA